MDKAAMLSSAAGNVQEGRDCIVIISK